jgi:hypothetical protein
MDMQQLFLKWRFKSGLRQAWWREFKEGNRDNANAIRKVINSDDLLEEFVVRFEEMFRDRAGDWIDNIAVLIELILENLPAIIELIMLIVSLFI